MVEKAYGAGVESGAAGRVELLQGRAFLEQQPHAARVALRRGPVQRGVANPSRRLVQQRPPDKVAPQPQQARANSDGQDVPGKKRSVAAHHRSIMVWSATVSPRLAAVNHRCISALSIGDPATGISTGACNTQRCHLRGHADKRQVGGLVLLRTAPPPMARFSWASFSFWYCRAFAAI